MPPGRAAGAGHEPGEATATATKPEAEPLASASHEFSEVAAAPCQRDVTRRLPPCLMAAGS